MLIEICFYDSFHPALKRAKAILESGELGAVKNITVNMIIPGGMIPANDIRFDYALGGGALMDLGCQWHIFLTLLLRTC
jgi:predicted dehydrogenase